jgi:hypothetical protein
VELDDILRERTAALKSQRERAKAALGRGRAQCGIAAAINAQKIDAFARLMSEKLDSADTNSRKSYIRSIIDAVEVDDRVSGSLVARTSRRPPSPANRPRTEMFVVLYANGAPRPTKMGTIVSPWRYDVVANHALRHDSLRRPSILRYASRSFCALWRTCS